MILQNVSYLTHMSSFLSQYLQNDDNLYKIFRIKKNIFLLKIEKFNKLKWAERDWKFLCNTKKYKFN